ncbi:MAG: histidine--tRNA ligase [Bacteroidales bacterium]
MAQKPSIPKGTRDFGPVEMARRDYIFNTIRENFKLYGYSPIETPAMENLSSLLGKYGEEGDRLLFKILNSGDAFSAVEPSMLSNSNSLSLKVCEKGLRYDLTVPFARFVVQHQNEIVFPFKRYQIQPVWRADRPQKGRYREFYQCDVDVIGSNSLLNELELVLIADKIFGALGIDVTIKINNRKILSGIAQVVGHPDKLTDITIAIDKIDKIGLDAVKGELLERGLDGDAISKIEPVLLLKGSTSEKIAAMRGVLASSEVGMLGLDEISKVFELISLSGVNQECELDLSLARGLNYYTGAIFEVKAKGVEIGSICGGGRYDDLTGIFGLPGVSGVGISFGADRIYDVLLALDKFPSEAVVGTSVLFANLGEREQSYVIPVVNRLRDCGVAVEIYPDVAKLKKQFDYADKKGIPFLVIVGDDEISRGVFNLKNLKSGEQSVLSESDLVGWFGNSGK